jgi:hypothetical protein
MDNLHVIKRSLNSIALTLLVVFCSSLNAAEVRVSHREAAKNFSEASACLHNLKSNLYTTQREGENWKILKRGANGVIITSDLNQDMFKGFLGKKRFPENSSPHLNYELLNEAFEEKLVTLYDEDTLIRLSDIGKRNGTENISYEEATLFNEANCHFNSFIDRAVIENIIDWRYTTFQSNYAERSILAEQLVHAFDKASDVDNMVQVREGDDGKYTALYNMNFKIVNPASYPSAVPQFNSEKLKKEMHQYFAEQSLEALQSFNKLFTSSAEVDNDIRMNFNRLVSDFISYRVMEPLREGGRQYLRWFLREEEETTRLDRDNSNSETQGTTAWTKNDQRGAV